MDQAQIVLYVTKELTAFRRDLVRDVIIPMEQRIAECCDNKSKSKSRSRKSSKSRKKPVPTAPPMVLNRKQGSFVGARPASKGPFSSPRRSKKKKTAKKTISVTFKGGKRRTRRTRRTKK